MKKFVLIFVFVFVAFFGKATTYVVTNTNASGQGSLAYAIQMCVATTGPHTITFNIPITDANYNSATGVWIISPTTNFTTITNVSVTIDGTTQTTNVGNTNQYGPEIVIDGRGTVDYGFRFMQAPNSSIKGLNIRRFTKGVQFYNSPKCSVTGCYVGTDEKADTIMSNDIGIEFISGSDSASIGGATTAEHNIISGNQHIGIRLLDVRYCKVCGNYIGTNRTGTRALPNYDGMSMEGAVQQCTIGGTTAAERNLISGNTDYGLPLFGVGATGNVIIGNYIGTDITGTQAIGNTYGVLFDDGSYGNIVGGEEAEKRNIISGNVGYGVFFYNNGTNSNVLKNNYIGTDVSGRVAVPNVAGIIIDGISYKNVMDSNIISGNQQVGIGINITSSDSNVIIRNRIGVNVEGNPLPNGMDGIRISQGPVKTIIGGTPAEANIIANNGGCGVYITNDNCTQHLISCNSFYNNTGLAIDLFSPGVNTNDVGDTDNGANNRLNFPEITSLTYSAGALDIGGTIDTPNPEQIEIQVYKAQPNPSGYGEGKIYICSVSPDANGNWSANVQNCSNMDYITTLAIDYQNNTSEFSRARNSFGFAEVKTIESADKYFVYPCPTHDYVTIKLPKPTHTFVELFNQNGVRLDIKEIDTQDIKLDLSKYTKGLYLIRLLGQTSVIVKN